MVSIVDITINFQKKFHGLDTTGTNCAIKMYSNVFKIAVGFKIHSCYESNNISSATFPAKIDPPMKQSSNARNGSF